MNVSTTAIDSSRAYHGWFQLSPRPREGLREGPGGERVELGSVRLSVSYSEDYIYPLEVYKPLQSLLLQSLETQVRGGVGKERGGWVWEGRG